jgi:hypothetical protein
MKNVIIIDVDTDRVQSLQIGKPSDSKQPTNPEEAKEIILTDLACVSETLNLMINIASDSGYGKKEDLVRKAIENLNNLIIKNDENEG